MMFAPLPSTRPAAARRQPQRRGPYPQALPVSSDVPVATEPVDGLAVLGARRATSGYAAEPDLFSGISEILEPASPVMPDGRGNNNACCAKSCDHECNWASVLIWRGATKTKCVLGSVVHAVRKAPRSKQGSAADEEEEATRQLVLTGGYVMLTDDFVAARPRTSLLGLFQLDSAQDQSSSDSSEETQRQQHARSTSADIAEQIASVWRNRHVLFQRRPSHEVYGRSEYTQGTTEKAQD